MRKALWNGIEVVITSTTGNRVAVMSGTRVRIPPIPPQTLIKSDLVRVFSYANFNYFYKKFGLKSILMPNFLKSL